MSHNFYVGSKNKVEVDKYWADVQNKRQEAPIPYKPNPLKFQYLLSNNYEPVTNTDMPMEPASAIPDKGFEDMEQMEPPDWQQPQLQQQLFLGDAN